MPYLSRGASFSKWIFAPPILNYNFLLTPSGGRVEQHRDGYGAGQVRGLFERQNMRKSRGASATRIIAFSTFILMGARMLLAQVRTASAAALDLSALQLVDSNAIPAFGNFYYAKTMG